MEVRLVGGSNDTGRLEANFGAEWGTIGAEGFDKNAAIVACKMLGFIGIGDIVENTFDGASLDIMLRNVVCNGDEDNLDECQSAWKKEGGSEAVAITCTNRSKLTFSPRVTSILYIEILTLYYVLLDIKYQSTSSICFS